MVFTTVAFYETTGAAITLGEINPVDDDHITIGTDLIVVPELNNVLAAMAFGITMARAQLASPSIRKLGYHELPKVSLAADPIAGTNRFNDFSESPIPLVHGESLKLRVTNAAAGLVQGILWLSDGSVLKVKEPTRTILWTGTSVTPAGAWTAVPLTATQTLPAGRYAIVGMNVITATVQHAARLIIIGHPWRPGVPTHLIASADLDDRFRNGNMGKFAEFEFDQPPKLEIMGTGASGAVLLYLDIVQIRAGRT